MFRRTSFLKRLLQFVLLLVVTAGISLGIAQPSSAQFPLLPEGVGPSEILKPPSGVTRYGTIETMFVRSPLSNSVLFTIASPTIYNRTPDAQGERQPVEQRAQEIQAKLLLLLRRKMDPKSLMFGVSQLNNVTVISVRDAEYTRPLVLVSVTTNDADFNGLPENELAEQWRDILEDDLRNRLANLPQDKQRIDRIVVGLLFITGIVAGVKYALSRRQRWLRQQKQDIDTTVMDVAVEVPPESRPTTLREQVEHKRATLLQTLNQDLTLDRRLAILDFLQWLLFWLLILAWYGGAAWVFTVSPYLLVNSLGFLEVLLNLLTIWFITGLFIRISRRLIDNFSVDRAGFNIGDVLTYGDAQRRQIRASTISGALKGLVTIVIAMIGIFSGMSALGVSTTSVVAIGSLAGLAITFGSQSLIKDLVNGLFILAEDQYAISDVIDVGTAAGLVENLNMRVTQIRSPDGELVTIPNSAIAQVKNLTRSWSRVAFSIDVAYRTDPDKALEVLRNVAQTFYDDPEWHDQIIAAPNVLGIDSVSHTGITITTWIQTAPGQQWAVGREFRLRVRRALVEHDIEIGTPRQIYQLEPASTGDNGSSQQLFGAS